jgi:hypothetical protein
MLPIVNPLNTFETVEQYQLYSTYLSREVLFEVYRTNNSLEEGPVSLLLVNDGQDLLTMPFTELLQQVSSDHTLYPLMVVACYFGVKSFLTKHKSPDILKS